MGARFIPMLLAGLGVGGIGRERGPRAIGKRSQFRVRSTTGKRGRTGHAQRARRAAQIAAGTLRFWGAAAFAAWVERRLAIAAHRAALPATLRHEPSGHTTNAARYRRAREAERTARRRAARRLK